MKKLSVYLHWGANFCFYGVPVFGLFLMVGAFVTAGGIDFWEFIGRLLVGFLFICGGVTLGTKLEEYSDEAWKRYITIKENEEFIRRLKERA